MRTVAVPAFSAEIDTLLEQARHKDLIVRAPSRSNSSTATSMNSLIAGIWKDRPDLDDFLENISEYRRQIDETESDE